MAGYKQGTRVLQNSFLGGEISPSMLGRIDDPYYKAGACELQNFSIQPQGAIRSRTGFKFVGEAKDSSKPVRLIPFKYSSEQSFILEFGHKTLRILREGQYVLKDNEVYVVPTQYNAEDLYTIDYSQNADILTLCSGKYAPTELRRYGATDWRFEAVITAPTINPPTGVGATPNYPSGTESYDKDKVNATYVVTALDKNGKESIASQPITVKCNYYLTGGTVTITWDKVDKAVRYRVYREVTGVFGFIGQTENNTITDQGDNPDMTTTPPRYAQPFTSKNAITEVTVVNGGSGYKIDTGSSVGSKVIRLPTQIRMRNIPVCGWVGGVYHNYWTYGGMKALIFDGDTKKLIEQIEIPTARWNRVISGHGDGRNLSDNLFYPNDFNGEYFTIQTSGKVVNNPYLLILGAGLCGNIYRPGDEFYSNDELYSTFYYDKRVWGNAGRHPTTKGEEQELNWRDYFPSPSEFWVKASSQVADSYTNNMTSDSWRYTTTQDPTKISAPRNGWYGGSLIDYLDYYNEEYSKADLNLHIEIEDPTGYGAILNPIVEDGVITKVEIISGGSNYTDPKLTVVSNFGSGAVLEATVGNNNEVDLEFPNTVTQYDQRRVFAGSDKRPLNVWLTNAGQQDLMMYHLPTLSDDRIELTAVTDNADKIKHAVALDSLILFTSSSELRVFTQNSDALTPDSVAVRAQSYVGANDVQPIIVNNSIVYVSSRGGHVRNLGYTYQSSSYVTDDLSIRSVHLFDSFDIKDLTLSKAPTQTVYAVSTSGALLACCYMPEQQIVAWSRIVTDGVFESACAIPEGEEDHLYVVVKRNINGVEKRYIERMGKIKFVDNTNTRQLDSYLDNVFDSPVNKLDGLSHLEGKEVQVLVDGKVQSNKVVKNGSITLDEEGKNVCVGLPYVSRLITTPLAIQANDLQGAVKNVSKVSLRISYDGDLWASNYPNGTLYRIKTEDLKFSNQSKSSKIVDITLSSSWDLQGQIVVENRNCLPLEISAIIGLVSMEI